MRSGADQSCYRIARVQHGVIGRRQAIAAGLPGRCIDRRLESGRWIKLYPGVYALAGIAASWEQRLVAACLWAGPAACASHRSAAALWGFPHFQPGTIELSTTGCPSCSGIRVHRRRLLSPHERDVVRHIPVTAVHTTLLDLGAYVPEHIVEAAVDNALYRGLTSVGKLRRYLEQAGGRGRRGTVALRAVLAGRNVQEGPCESPLESRLFRVIKKAGLPLPVRQFKVEHRGELIARVDFAYPDLKVAIEADGYAWHHGKQRWERDLQRRNLLESNGWRVLNITWDGLRSRPQEVLELIQLTASFQQERRKTSLDLKGTG
jgi:very-short-patch-repair endonuclease